MPPLYRMPVFYLVLAALGVALGLGKAFRGNGHTGEAVAASATDRDGDRPSPPPVPEAAPPEAEDDGILRTADGLRRKILVKSLDLVPSSQPEAGLPAPAPMP